MAELLRALDMCMATTIYELDAIPMGIADEYEAEIDQFCIPAQMG